MKNNLIEEKHVSRNPQLFLDYLRTIVAETKDGVTPGYKIRHKIKIFPRKELNAMIIPISESDDYIWILNSEFKEWLAFFRLYNIEKVRKETFKITYKFHDAKGLAQKTFIMTHTALKMIMNTETASSGSNENFYELHIEYKVKSVNESDSICMCACHVQGTHVRHLMPCCENTYQKYLTPEGELDKELLEKIKIVNTNRR